MVLKYVKMKTSKKIPLKTKNAKIINFYTGNIFGRFENHSRTNERNYYLYIQ